MNVDAIERVLTASSKFPTPILVFDAQTLRNACDALLSAACDGQVNVVTAVKACYLRMALEQVRAAGIGAEIVSDLEFRLARAAGFGVADLVLNGMGRPAALLAEVAAGGGLVICDTPGDAAALLTIAQSLTGHLVRVGIRIRPVGLPFDDVYVGTGSKLGLDPRESHAQDLIKTLDRHPSVRLEALHCHVGAGGATIQNLLSLLGCLENALGILRENGLGHNVSILDLGGGLPAYDHGVWWNTKSAMAPLVEEAGRVLPHGRLIIEPGRAVFSAAGALVATVVDVRRRGDIIDVVVDGGTNVLLPLPTANYRLLHPSEDEVGPVHIVGDGVTNPANVLVRVRLSKSPRVGDRLLIGQAGAYTQAMAEFWIYEPCPVGWVEKDGRLKLALDHAAIQRARTALLGI